MNNSSDDESYSSDDSDLAFAFVDFTGVDFGSDTDADADADADATKEDNGRATTDGDDETKEMTTSSKSTKNNEGIEGGVQEDTKVVEVSMLDKLLVDGCKSLSLQNNNEGEEETKMNHTTTKMSKSASSSSSSNIITFDKVVVTQPSILTEEDKVALEIECNILLNDCTDATSADSGTDTDTNSDTLLAEGKVDVHNVLNRIQSMSKQLCNGDYIDVLGSVTAQELFQNKHTQVVVPVAASSLSSVSHRIRELVMTYCTNTAKCIEVQMIAVAALNLFLQVNYTGPSLHHGGVARPGKEDHVNTLLNTINPHQIFASQLTATTSDDTSKTKASNLNAKLKAPVHVLVEGNEEEENDDDDGEEETNREVDTEKKTVEKEKEKQESKDNNSIEMEEPHVDAQFHTSVLAELSVDGEWPCPVCKYPYFLLLARSIFLTLADPNRPDWSHSIMSNNHNGNNDNDNNKIIIRKDSSSSSIQNINFSSPTKSFIAHTLNLSSAQLWSSRAAVAHVRLLQADEPSSLNLWSEVKYMFDICKTKFCHDNDDDNKGACQNEKERQRASKILLEYGLAEHHFDVEKKGKVFFQESLQFADLDVEVTGADGRRTKYQEDATAQMLVRAKPTNIPNTATTTTATTTTDENVNVNEKGTDSNENVAKQMVDHQDETILYDKVKYVDKEDNTHFELSILQQTILLALCLDVKNKNPMDGLTAEEMGAFLERVLQQHDDWMVYATGLLERAWLECERSHTRERAILQIQALVDQHSNRLTLTQSTFQAAVEDSAPPQDRLRYIHYIVYPPRWAALRDLAERYAKMGIVTSAAEIFESIELWDEVVECYRRAGKEHKAEEIVRKRLLESETPRMWAALGDITKDPSYYERSLEVSKGKFSGAYVALGKYYADKGDFSKAAESYKEAVKVKPLSPQVWFSLGAMSMRLKDWSTALQAFTEVVQQEPEEGDAWANVAAIHMNNNEPSEAYPALNESLKLNRNNWRVWFSKLYTCMDLKKYDEAVQASIILIDFKLKRNASEGIPNLDEKIVRGLVGGVISAYKEAQVAEDTSAIQSAKRSLSRVRELLSKLSSSMKSEPWLYETSAFFHESVGCDDLALDELMKEYRALQAIRGWETDQVACPNICRVISQISELKLKESDDGELRKFKFLVNGVIKKIKAAYFDESRLPLIELNKLGDIIEEVENKIKKS